MKFIILSLVICFLPFIMSLFALDGGGELKLATFVLCLITPVVLTAFPLALLLWFSAWATGIAAHAVSAHTTQVRQRRIWLRLSNQLP